MRILGLNYLPTSGPRLFQDNIAEELKQKPLMGVNFVADCGRTGGSVSGPSTEVTRKLQEITSIGQTPTQDRVGRLVQFLEDSDSEVRIYAISTLIDLVVDKELIRPNGPNEKVAKPSLGLKIDKIIAILTAVSHQDLVKEVRDKAIWGLTVLGIGTTQASVRVVETIEN